MNKYYPMFIRLLDSAVRNLSNAFYDQYVEVNTKFRARAGLKQIVIRRQLWRCCDWCAKLAGTYVYGAEPKDVWRRHQNCKCLVTTQTEKGTFQDAWSKTEYDSQREARIARAEEIADEIEKDYNASEERKKLAEQIRQALLEEKNTLNKSWLNKSKQFKTVEELKFHSNSDILSKGTYEDIVKYFRNEHNILVSGLYLIYLAILNSSRVSLISSIESEQYCLISNP